MSTSMALICNSPKISNSTSVSSSTTSASCLALNGKWVSTKAPCHPLNNSWNHLTIQFERTSSNDLMYKTITLNGVSSTINATYPPFSAVGWYGIVVNFQLDGNYKQSPYTVYLDNLSVTYY